MSTGSPDRDDKARPSLPTFRDAFPILTVRRMPPALAFSRDGLGFAIHYRWPANADRDGEIVFATLRLRHAEVGLGIGGGGDARTAPPAPNNRPTAQLCVYTDDVDAAVAHLAAFGATTLLAPVTQPWGERMAYVADPDGYPVMLAAPV